jgi:hypothetical protein
VPTGRCGQRLWARLSRGSATAGCRVPGLCLGRLSRGAHKRRGRAASRRSRGRAGAPAWLYDGEATPAMAARRSGVAEGSRGQGEVRSERGLHGDGLGGGFGEVLVTWARQRRERRFGKISRGSGGAWRMSMRGCARCGRSRRRKKRLVRVGSVARAGSLLACGWERTTQQLA